MEEMASLWSYQESVDELKLKIHYTAQELETVKARANEEMNRNSESVKQLLQLLKFVCHERDEARDQIQKLFIKTMPSSMHNNHNTMISNYFPTDQFHHLNHHTPLLKPPAKPNNSISIAESNSFSDAYNHSTSSPVDSLFDPVTSPEFSNINTNTSFVLSNNGSTLNASGSFRKTDHATLMMEGMIKGKTLPQKGNFLQAVIEAGPLMETLLVVNPVPNWPNLTSLPSFRIPPCGNLTDVGRGGGGTSIMSFDHDVNLSDSRGRMVGGCPNNWSCSFGYQVEKRQRFQ